MCKDGWRTHLIERHEDQELPDSQLQIEQRRVTDASPNAPARDLTERTRRVNMDLDRELLQKPALQLPLPQWRDFVDFVCSYAILRISSPPCALAQLGTTRTF